MLFSTSIGVGFAQRVWYGLHEKPFSLEAVGVLFTLRDNPLGFFNTEVLCRAKIASIIAALSWALALVPILVPASISVRLDTFTSQLGGAGTLPIYTLNLTKDVSELQYRNNTPIFPIQLAQYEPIGASWRLYGGVTTAATGLIYNTLYGKRIINGQSPCGANCSFTHTFNGPAYKCDDVDFVNDNDPQNPFCPQGTTTARSSFGICGSVFENVGPPTSLSYITWYIGQNSTRQSCQARNGCVPATDAWQDGKLWVAHQYMLPAYRDLFDGIGTVKDPNTSIPPEALEKHMFVCQSYNATYTLRRSYQDFQQSITGDVAYLNPTNFNTIKTRIISPESYAAYAIHQALYSLLNGSIAPNGRAVPTDTTHLAMSALVENMPFPPLTSSNYLTPSAQKPIRDLRDAVQQLHFNITVGMLSFGPELLYAENGTATGVETFTTENVWSYDPLILVLVYAVAAAADLAVIVIGVVAMVRNRGASGFEFARVLATTKASEALDVVIAREWGDGLDPMPKEVQEVKVRYGVVKRGGREKVGFGLKGEVAERGMGDHNNISI